MHGARQRIPARHAAGGIEAAAGDGAGAEDGAGARAGGGGGAAVQQLGTSQESFPFVPLLLRVICVFGGM